MYLILEGKIISPVITKRLHFKILGCKAEIIQKRRRYYSKINAGKPMYPYSFISYLGNIVVRFFCETKDQAIAKLNELLVIDHIGRFKSEGMGKIQWINGSIEKQKKKAKTSKPFKNKIKIRKGLPHYLPERIKKLITVGILHDFFHTSKHRSKIYVEPSIQDKQIIDWCKQHHDETKEPLLKQLRYYDQLSAMITRKHRSPRLSRYNWKSSKKINFKKLAIELTEVSTNVNKLYQYIYESKDLELLNESLEFGHSSLRFHLVLLTNLIVQDFKKGKI